MTMPLTAIWRTFTSSYLALVLIPIIFQLVTFAAYSNAQTFDPELEDEVYLNKLEKEIHDEVNTTKVNFYKQAHLLDNVARQFVAAQLKENLFIALRVLAEKELTNLRGNSSDDDETTAPESGISAAPFLDSESSSTTESEVAAATSSEVSTVTSTPTTTTLRSHIRRKRQDDGDDDGDDADAAAAAAAAAGVPNRPTIPPQIGLLPQVANLVRVIFGGNGQVNFTSYVASATKLLPRPVGNQVLGLVKILNNANQNNRNSFTTANPLTTGQLPANLDLKSPAVAGLTPEQLLALGLPSNAALEGLTPEQLNSLAGLAAAAGTPGAAGVGLPGAAGAPGAVGAAGGAAAGLPGGLTPQDIAYLAALGIPDLPTLGPSPPPPPPRSTRKPRPNYAPHNKNKQPPQQQQQQPQLQPDQQLHNQQQLHLQQQQLHLQQQQQLQPPPAFHQPAHEQNFLAPTYPPKYVNGPPQYGHNPQFASAEKDILPLNLNPNKQTLSEIQQHVNAQHSQVPKYQETPQSAAQPSRFGPTSNNFLPGNNYAPVGGTTQQHGVPSPISQPPSNYYQPQSNLGGAHNGQQESQSNFVSIGKPERDVHSTSGISPNQAPKPQKPSGSTGGKTRRPRPPSAFQQQQAQLQAQQLQQLQLLQQQETLAGPERPQPQLQEEHQPIQAQRPQKTQVQQHQPQFQKPSQSQYIQQPQSQFNQPQQSTPQFNQQQQSPPPFNQQQQPQSQFNQQPPNPSFPQRPQYQQQPQSQFQQQEPPIQQGSRPQQPPFQGGRPQSQFQQQLTPSQLQQKYQQQLFQPRPPVSQVDEDESEEADTDYNDPFERKSRQLNLLQNLLPTFLRPNNNRNNNNNNGQPQQPSQSNNNNNSNTTTTTTNNNNQGNNTTSGGNNNNNNQNNGFDLNMFAQNLSRGMGDVIRVMPDLFRGAREGLQLIQALSSILRAFPGLADALPILS